MRVKVSRGFEVLSYFVDIRSTDRQNVDVQFVDTEITVLVTNRTKFRLAITQPLRGAVWRGQLK
jgi:hypothetical protein